MEGLQHCSAILLDGRLQHCRLNSVEVLHSEVATKTKPLPAGRGRRYQNKLYLFWSIVMPRRRAAFRPWPS